jgi:O-antigen/teichoic acid export membrane protein
MKRSYWALIVAVLVLLTTILWISTTKEPINLLGILQYGIILVLVGFGFYFGISRMKSERRGEPAEDEMSKKIMRKASSYAFFISIYMWLALMYFSDRIKLETHTQIGGGIMGMAVIFLLCWVFIKLRGMKDE